MHPASAKLPNTKRTLVIRCSIFSVSAFRTASAKLPNTKPNARWRDGFSLVPSIPVGCADKRKAGELIQSGIIYMAKKPATIILKSSP